MNASNQPALPGVFHALRRFTQPESDAELCEFCSVPLTAPHRHLLEFAHRKLVCVCDACALVFVNAKGRYKLIPRDARPLPDFRLTEAEWAALGLPIHLAFFFRSTPAKKVIAMYPSPAGATESLLTLANWEKIEKTNPALARMEADVEALLVNRLAAVPEYYLAPIDRCFELVGLIRLHWRGFSGGERVWAEVGKFFLTLRDGGALGVISQTEALHA